MGNNPHKSRRSPLKTRTYLHAGACPEPTRYGVVEKVNSYYYAAIRDYQDGSQRFTNYSYTYFDPNGQGLYVGEPVNFTLYPPDYPNAGKVSCVSPA